MVEIPTEHLNAFFSEVLLLEMERVCKPYHLSKALIEEVNRHLHLSFVSSPSSALNKEQRLNDIINYAISRTTLYRNTLHRLNGSNYNSFKRNNDYFYTSWDRESK